MSQIATLSQKSQTYNINAALRERQDGAITGMLVLTTFLACFGSSMLYGYNMAVLNGPGDEIRCFFNQTFMKGNCSLFEKPRKVNGTEITFSSPSAAKLETFYALTASLFVIFGAIGAFCTSVIADNIGRKRGLLFNHFFVIIGGIVSTPTVYANSPILLYVGRCFIGFNCGVTIGLASIYLTEIAPQRVRGAIGACHQLAVTMGILVAYITGLKQLMNTPTLWPFAQGLTTIPAILSLCLLPFCPESPRFLFMRKNQEAAAREALCKFNNASLAEELIQEMKVEKESTESQPSFKFLQLFTSKDLRMPLAVAIIIQVMQQLSGINAVVAFSSTMLKEAGVDEEMIPYFNIGMGTLNVICTLVALPLLEKFGRRTLLLVPSLLLVACLLGLTISVNLAKEYPVCASISVALVYLYICGFSFGLGTIPALIVAEVFRQEPRTAAYSVSQFVQWVVCLGVSTSYPNLQKALGGWVFLVYMVVVACCWVFFFLFMPETKNRSFDDVARDMAFGNVLVKKSKGDRVLLAEEGRKPGSSGTTTPIGSKPHLVTKVELDDSDKKLLSNQTVELNSL